MTSAKIKLSIIVLFYHGERWIEACIQSLENQSLAKSLYEIILIDNGGSTPSVNKYQRKDNVSVVHFHQNYGFAGGNNLALAHARGEIIVLMNQDVVVHFNCLEEFLTAFEQHPEAGVISGNMLMVSQKDVIDPFGSTSKSVGFYKLSPLGYASYLLMDTDNDMVPVEFVSGNALGFRRIILKDVGNRLFDDRLGSYAEDLDLCLRLKKTKWQLYVRPRAVVYHYRNEAFSGKPLYMLKKFFRVSSNRLMVYTKNLGTTDFVKKLPALLLGIPAKAARQDGDRHFYLLKFVIALGLTPFVFVYFGLRVLKNTKPEKI